MSVSKFFLWFGMMFPLMFSPGPANVTLAAMGGRFGFRKSLPFIAGVNLIVLLHALLIGFGALQFLEAYPALFALIQPAGALYLVYLAFRFLKSSKIGANGNTGLPRFWDGFMLGLLNAKVVTLTMVMFSQVLDNESGKLLQVVTFSIGLALLTTGATLTWAAGGAWLTRKLASPKVLKLQGYVFGSMLLGVAVWMLI
ncbi:LysE family translocator [candidate division KSB1 bacterium]|nr:LysE family translocator [candidate division KSB1 bacterium]NIR69246.1 LysE family translocator [candidate division KSB1 bacterium]NIS27420.1 LysE family translocator [candidate division KSB1 bacterium]NIT74245.1 LysE family translocator [candidate division KSB1 bacterium]NIU28137.1 LysE family translocator [candidate division KSB1 bacterium]